MDIVKLFKESTTNGKYRIFLDLDGVLVNWNKGYKEALTARDPEIIQATGYNFETDSPYAFEDKLLQYYLNKGENPKKAKSKAKSRFWRVIQGDRDWWVNLEWMPDGKDLFSYCLNLRNNGTVSELNILSSPSSDPVCEEGKRMWLDKHGLTKFLDNIIIFKDKYKHATGPQDILVDDTKKKIDEWTSLSNGSGVLHTSTANSIPQIEKIIGGTSATSTNDTSSI